MNDNGDRVILNDNGISPLQKTISHNPPQKTIEFESFTKEDRVDPTQNTVRVLTMVIELESFSTKDEIGIQQLY